MHIAKYYNKLKVFFFILCKDLKLNYKPKM